MRLATRCLSLAVMAGLLSAPALADEKNNWHKYREAVMDVLKGHIAAISMVAFNQVEDTGYQQMHADGLAAATAELGKIFPPDSGHDSHALPAIWEQPDEFAAAVTEAEAATAGLREAIAGGDRRAVAQAFKRTGDACKGCHESFRAEDD